MAATALGNRKRHIPLDPMLPESRRTGPGRPSKYKVEYCDIVESLGRQGKSAAQIAAILNVDRASFDRWAAVHLDFAQSLARAKTYEHLFSRQAELRGYCVPELDVADEP